MLQFALGRVKLPLVSITLVMCFKMHMPAGQPRRICDKGLVCSSFSKYNFRDVF